MSRIALVTEAFHPGVDESTVTVRHLADEFLRRGHEVLLISAAPGQGRYRRSRVVRVRAWEPVGSQVRAAFTEFRPDLVFVASPAAIGRKALKHAGRLGVATVTVEHRAPGEFLVEPWVTGVPRRSDLLLTVSRWQQERLVDVGHPSHVWHPGVDLDTFTPAARDRHLHARWARTHHKHGPLTVVGYVGPLRKRDGVRRLRGLESLPRVRPVLIGEGRQRDWLRDRMRRVVILPRLQGTELATAVASFDALIHPGEQVTAGHSLRAAAACGVPVVAARAAGSAEIVRHLESGLLATGGDTLLDEVAALCADPTRAELGRHARSLADQRSWAVAVDDLLELVNAHLAPARAA